MLDERLFFQTRIFRMFCEKTKLAAVASNALFDKYAIWKYLDDTYEVLHLSGDECALDEVIAVLKLKGALL
ncbi:MAG: DUF3791 domain-containing protein [Phascolarctobacterium sp.]|nr:DUF3791 domain-containing protein [Phascolarctobacterium sp.]